MPLKSRLFQEDAELEAASVSNPAHIVPGAKGEHVQKIQVALQVLDGASISPAELASQLYGPTTARAVLAYKKKRDIVNRSYQTQADNIVGIMTVHSLDDELAKRDTTGIVVKEGKVCQFDKRQSPGFEV